MRIIDQKKDYYDCIQAYGQDHSLQYVRTPLTMKLGEAGAYRHMPYLFYSYSNNLPNNITGTEYVVGFCGKIYPVVEFQLLTSTEGQKSHAFCYTQEELEKFFQESLSKKEFESYETGQSKRQYYGMIRKLAVKKYFDDFKAIRDTNSDLFKKGSPIFLIHDRSLGGGTKEPKITYNPLLNSVEFYRVIDPFTAFQEIRMWLSNEAVPMKPIPEMDDLTKISQHGFDKYSFRKDSVPKPPKRKYR